MERLFAPLLQQFQRRLDLPDVFLQLSLMLLIDAHRGFRKRLSEAHILLQFLNVFPLFMLLADLSIQLLQAIRRGCRPDLRRRIGPAVGAAFWDSGDRKSTRLNSSHLGISYAVFFLKKNT